jgi:hypothetical protein
MRLPMRSPVRGRTTRQKGQASSAKPVQKPYTGILVEPMPNVAFLGPTDQELHALIDAKMKALFVHYGLDHADAFEPGPKLAAAWSSLAWRLARDHVPGFSSPPRQRGRPPTRKSDDVTLAMHVELLRRRDGLSDREAVRWIASQNLVSGTELALLQRYKRAKKQFASMSRLFDNIEARKGHDVFTCIMEKSLSGDDKDSFLSPQ